MASQSLNKTIFRLTAGLVLLCTLAILLSVWSSTINHAEKQLNSTLSVAESVILEVLGNREEQLLNSANILVKDFGFIRAFATKDDATIQSVFENHGNRIDADLMTLMTLDGVVTNSSSDAIAQGSVFLDEALRESVKTDGGASTYVLFNERLYQVLLVSIEAPTPIGYAAIGFEVNDALLSRLKSITQLDITLSAATKAERIFQRSTLQTSYIDESTFINVGDLTWYSFLLLPGDQFISDSVNFSESDELSIRIEYSQDIESIYGDFSSLQRRISLIAFGSFVASLVLGAMLSRRLAQPLLSLSSLSQRIASGDYDHPIKIKTKTTEIAELTSAFLSMQGNIKEREHQIHYQATHDLLSGLKNRYEISRILDAQFESNPGFQAIGINILGFRGINDVFGHHNGDHCLIVIARRMMGLPGTTARLNGGEFIWLPKAPLSNDELASVQNMLEADIEVESVVIQLRMAIAVLECPENANDTATLLKRLTITLDRARTLPNTLIQFNEDLEARYARRIAIITELKKALSTDSPELNLFYQPKLNLNTGKITQAEALIRWNSESLGFVPPDEFIEIAEQSGLIGIVTEWVVNRAIRDAKGFRDANVDVCIAINISARDVVNPALLNIINTKLEQSNLPPSCLAFEITESDLVADSASAARSLSEYRQAGFNLAIDDFGTGYSSLAYLKSLPVTDLKIDKSFVLNLDTDEDDKQIVQTIIGLAHSFGLQVIAEGVENHASLELLKSWRCEYMQGYHLSRPLPFDDFVQWYDERANDSHLIDTL